MNSAVPETMVPDSAPTATLVSAQQAVAKLSSNGPSVPLHTRIYEDTSRVKGALMEAFFVLHGIPTSDNLPSR